MSDLRVAWMVGAIGLVGCRLVADSGITYRECHLTSSSEEFSSSLVGLKERCWESADFRDPADLFVAEGDLVIRVSTPADGLGERWDGIDTGPILFRHYTGNFFVATRAEAVSQVSGDDCLSDDNRAGLAVRPGNVDLPWSTFLIGPFRPSANPDAPCGDDANPLPILGVVANRANVWGAPLMVRGAADAGIGSDGDADIAICRVNGNLVFYHRDLTGSDEGTEWTSDAAFDGVTGPVDVGMTASGGPVGYEVEGHFTWTLSSDVVGSDGCKGTLDSLVLPDQ